MAQSDISRAADAAADSDTSNTVDLANPSDTAPDSLNRLLRTALVMGIVVAVLAIVKLSFSIMESLNFPVSVLQMALVAVFLEFAMTRYFRVTDSFVGRVPAFFLALLVLATAFSVVGLLVAPEAKPQLSALFAAAPEQVPHLWEKVRGVIQSHDPDAAASIDSWIKDNTSSPEQFFKLVQGYLPFAPKLVGSVMSTIGCAFITMILFLTLVGEPTKDGVEDSDYIAWIASRFPKHRKVVLAVLNRTRDDVGRWAPAQFFVSSLLGTNFGFGLWLLGVPFAIAIGLLTIFVDMIPYGNVIALGLSIVGLLSDVPNHTLYENGMHFGIVMAMFVGLTQIKDNLISPRIMNRVLHIHPFFIFTFALIGLSMDGVLGAILAMPVLIFVRAIEEAWMGTSVIVRQPKPFRCRWLGRLLFGAHWFLHRSWRAVSKRRSKRPSSSSSS